MVGVTAAFENLVSSGRLAAAMKTEPNARREMDLYMTQFLELKSHKVKPVRLLLASHITGADWILLPTSNDAFDDACLAS